MCLAIPVKVLEKADNFGIVELSGVKRKVNLSLLDDINIGDYVILHAGFAIQKLSETDAQETLSLIREGLSYLDEVHNGI